MNAHYFTLRLLVRKCFSSLLASELLFSTTPDAPKTVLPDTVIVEDALLLALYFGLEAVLLYPVKRRLCKTWIFVQDQSLSDFKTAAYSS